LEKKQNLDEKRNDIFARHIDTKQNTTKKIKAEIENV
jgi:hypothetical protein